MLLTVIEFVGFTVLVAVLSWWKTKDEDLSSKEGYFLAGRGLPGIVIAGSLMMTNLSAEQLVGTNGQAFSGSMSSMAWEATSGFALLVLAFVILPRFLKGGIATIPQFYQMRYDTFTMRMFSCMFLIAYVVTMLPTILYSGSVALAKIFNIEEMFGVSYFWAILLVCFSTGLIGMAYSVFGGLKAVAYSDTINGVGLIIGGFAVPILGIFALGRLGGGGGSFSEGLHYLLTTTPEKMNAWAEPTSVAPYVPWPLLFTGMFVNNMFYWATNQSIIQRSLGGRDLAEAQKGAIWAGFFKCLDVFVIVLPGIIAYQLLTAQGAIDTSVGSAGDQAYPLLVMEVMPPAIMGFFAAVMFGAILSSFNSVLNSASTMFTLDLYRSAFKPGATDAHCVKVGKIYGTIAGCVSIVIAPFVMNAQGITTFLNSMSQFVSLPVLCAVLGVFLFRRLPAYTPKVVTVFHVVCYGAFLLIAPTYPGTDDPIHYLYAMAVLFPIELIIMWALDRYRPAEEYVPEDVGAVDLTPWRYRHVVSIIGLLLAVAIYVVFSPLGIAA